MSATPPSIISTPYVNPPVVGVAAIPFVNTIPLGIPNVLAVTENVPLPKESHVKVGLIKVTPDPIRAEASVAAEEDVVTVTCALVIFA